MEKFNDKQIKAALKFVEEHPNVDFPTIDESLGGWLGDEESFDMCFLDKAMSPRLTKTGGKYAIEKSEGAMGGVQNSETKVCPFCGGTILKTAVKCKHCKKFINEAGCKVILRYRANVGDDDASFEKDVVSRDDLMEMLKRVENDVMEHAKTEDDEAVISSLEIVADELAPLSVSIWRADTLDNTVNIFSHERIVLGGGLTLKSDDEEVEAIGIPKKYGRSFSDETGALCFLFDSVVKMFDDYYREDGRLGIMSEIGWPKEFWDRMYEQLVECLDDENDGNGQY